MKVRALADHGNIHGDRWTKLVGDEYEHPDPRVEIKVGNVEVIDAGEGKVVGNARGRKGAGAGQAIDG